MKNTIIIAVIAVSILFTGNWIVTKHYTNQILKAQPQQFMGGGRGFNGPGFMMDTNRMVRMQEMQKQRDAREQEYLKTLSPTDKANYEKMKAQMEEQRRQPRDR